MTNAEIRREAGRRGERQLTGTFFLAYALAYVLEFAAPFALPSVLRFGIPAVYVVIGVMAYAPCARAAIAAWRRAEGIESPAKRGVRAFGSGLLAAAVFAVFLTVFLLALVSCFIAAKYGPDWPLWLTLAARCFFGMWLNMLFFAVAAMDGEKPLRALGRGLAGLFRHFFRIAGMQLALWWQTWLLAVLVVALLYLSDTSQTWPHIIGLFAAAVILFFWRGPHVRLAYAGLAMELFEVNE